MKFLEFLKKDRDNRLIQVISFFWIIAKIGSRNAWLPENIIPPVPVFPEFEETAHLVLYAQIISIGLLVFTVFKPHNIGIAFVIGAETISVLCNYLLLQPWEYIYLIVFVFYAFLKGHSAFFPAVRIFIASVYILSGLHKFDRIFLVTVWNRIFLNEYLGLAQETVERYKLFFIGLTIPVIELSLGLLLLLSKNYRGAASFLIIMHIIILVVVDPLGLRNNSIIWIWNLSMIAILWFLRLAKNLKARPFGWALIMVFVFLPAILVLRGNSSYLTFNLFTGKNDHMYVQQKKKFKDEFPSKKLPSTAYPYQYYFNLYEVTMKETSLSPPPEKWYMQKMKIKLLDKFPESRIIIDVPPN